MFEEKELLSALMDWWESKRPERWSESNHLQLPTVNCKNVIEEALASCLAAYLTSPNIKKRTKKSGPGFICFHDTLEKSEVDQEDTLQVTVVKIRKSGICHIEIYDKETGRRVVKKINVDMDGTKS